VANEAMLKKVPKSRGVTWRRSLRARMPPSSPMKSFSEVESVEEPQLAHYSSTNNLISYYRNSKETA